MEIWCQVLTLGAPPIEAIGEPKQAAELARIANDEMAELVAKYPNRFVSAIASLPMNDMDAALKEADRAINDLKFRGSRSTRLPMGNPLTCPNFCLYMKGWPFHNLPIWIHPVSGENSSRLCWRVLLKVLYMGYLWVAL